MSKNESYTYTNQKKIIINKVNVEGKNYGVFEKESMFKASKELTDSGFKLWCYLNSNQDRFDWNLSKVDVVNSMGLSESSYRRAVKDLISKNYLVQKEEYLYDFYECGQNDTVQNDTMGQIDTIQNETTIQIEQRGGVKLNRGVVSKRTEGGVKLNTQIVQDNTINNTINSTMSTNSTNKLSDELILQTIKLYQSGYKYSKSNPEIQSETGLTGKQIFTIIETYNRGDYDELLTNNNMKTKKKQSETTDEMSQLQLADDCFIDKKQISDDIYTDDVKDKVCSDYYQFAINEGADKDYIDEWFITNFNWHFDVNTEQVEQM